jgi:molecular chaperone GrpE
MDSEENQAVLTAARQENAELRDKYLRAAAAIENARKQAQRDAEQRANERLRGVYTRLLEVADNLERALSYARVKEYRIYCAQTALNNQGYVRSQLPTLRI